MNHPAKVLGEELSAARKAKGLSLEDVSRATKIRKPILLALEEGRLEDLPPAVFMAGHLRAYAEVLDLDGEPYVERLRQLTRAPLADGRSEETPTAPRVRAWPILLAVLIVALAVGGGVWFWLHHGAGSVRPAPEGAPPAGGPMEPAPSPPASVSEKPPMGQAWEGERTGATQVAPEAAVQAAPSSSAQATAPETSVEAPEKSAPESNPPSARAEPAAPEASAEATAAAPAAPQGDLVIACSKPCWLALWADGQRKIYRQLRAGETVALNGKQFKADIGDPSALSITFQGRSVELPGAPGKPLKNFQIPSETRPQTP